MSASNRQGGPYSKPLSEIHGILLPPQLIRGEFFVSRAQEILGGGQIVAGTFGDEQMPAERSRALLTQPHERGLHALPAILRQDIGALEIANAVVRPEERDQRREPDRDVVVDRKPPEPMRQMRAGQWRESFWFEAVHVVQQLVVIEPVDLKDQVRHRSHRLVHVSSFGLSRNSDTTPVSKPRTICSSRSSLPRFRSPRPCTSKTTWKHSCRVTLTTWLGLFRFAGHSRRR